MKTKIKRHSRSVLSVVLALCMLLSCMTAGMIMTDAARVTDDEAVGGSDSNITDYYFKGSFDNWAKHYVNSSGNAYININTVGTYEFVVITGGGTQRRANFTFSKSGSYNTFQDQSNFKIKVTTPGTYTFKTSTMNSGGSVTVTLTFPSGGSTTNDWKLLDGNTWAPGTSTKKFTLNSATGYYEYSQYFSTGNNYFRVSNGATVYRGDVAGNTPISSDGTWKNLVAYNGSENHAFWFQPSPAGTYIVQIDATNNKVRIQAATKYNVTFQTPTNGALSSSLSSATAGESVTITATPNSGYSLKSLVLTYDDIDHDVTNSVVGNSYTFAMPAFAVTAKATFTNAKTIYFNNYVAQWSKVFVYTKNAGGEEGNGPAPGLEMTRVGTSSIYSAEIPADTNYIVFSGSGGATNEGATITYKTDTNYGNALPSDYSEYKATAANGSTGEWSAHSDRNNVYTVTPGASVTTNNNLYYNGLTATLYDYYTDGEYNNGNANWINGIKDKSGSQLAEYCLSDGSQYSWNPYRTLNTALSTYASQNGVTYPLYFGNLNITNSNGVGQGDLGTGSYTNWHYKINNSTKLNPNTASITGLANSTEGDSTINHSSGAAMAMFDEDWLSQENATGNPLATILHSSAFPVRKITEAAGTTYNKIYASLSSSYWGQDNPVIFAHLFDSNSHTCDVMMTYNSSSGYYEASIPTDYSYEKVIFVRNKTGTSSIAWSGANFWNQSGEYALPSSKTDSSRLYTNNGWNSFSKVNIDSSYGITSSKAYTYYEYDSTNGTDNAFIKNINTSDHTATIEYSDSDKVWSSGVGSNGAQPGFYPFDNMTGNIINKNVGSSKVAHDLGYGMKLEIPFSLNENGTLDGTTTGSAQTFNFSGDDDLWVFIDGHLVLDLGGAHFKAEGSIDFKNKTATSTTKVVSAATAAASTDKNTVLNATATYSNNFGSWFNSDPEALHTMTLYYMERGMYDSNLKFDFSFHAIQNLYTTEKKIRTNSINSGFYIKDATTTYNGQNITKFEQSYQDEVFNVDHKVSSAQDGTYDYPLQGFDYSKVYNKVTEKQTYTSGNGLIYNLRNDELAQFNGKFITGDYFQLTETAAADNKYSYTPTLTVYDDANNTKRNDVTSAGANTFRFRFHEPDPTGLEAVNIRAQLENIMKQHDLKITKSIGEREDQNTEFTFRVTFNFDYEGSGVADNGYEGYPLFISSDKVNNKVQMYSVREGSSTKHGYFKIKAGETITIPRIPEGAQFKIEEDLTDITNYTYGGMSAIGATATAVNGENAVTMTMGTGDINVTALNNDNTVKGTIRVKYAPSYYDFEHGSNITTDEYKKDGSVYNHISQNVQCVTDFTDEATTSSVISQYTTEETVVRDASKTFDVKVTDVNAGGYLFIGWYDEAGNRYNNTDETQHSFTASAAKDEDRIFEARFITAPNYRIDFAVPTRLWGNRIYKVFGKVDNSMISNNYIGYDSSRETTASVEKRYYLTGQFVEAKKPSETIFLKDITWPNIDNGKTDTQYKISKWVTCNDVTSNNVETVTQSGDVTYDMYRYVAASVADRKVTIDFYNDCSNQNTRNFQWEGNYGDSVYNNETVAVNIPADKTFYRWKIETLNSLGGTALTPNDVLVTYDYSSNFNYVAYDNYKVTVELLDKESGGTEYSPYASKNPDNPYHAYAPKNTTSVINLGQTRSHWNETTNGLVYVPDPDKGESLNNTNANYNYDRMFIDLALSYSDGNETKLNTVDDLNVGFIIQYWNGENWINWKTEVFSSKLLGDKNRIEYYYGFQNAAGNRAKNKFRVQPIIDGDASGTPLEFDFSASQFSAQTNY